MKKMILLLGLILGICNMGVTAFAEESLVEVLIKTRPETGNVYTGIEQIDMDVYDLTEWRQKRASNEKADKEYIMDTYPTKERLATFVQTEEEQSGAVLSGCQGGNLTEPAAAAE